MHAPNWPSCAREESAVAAGEGHRRSPEPSGHGPTPGQHLAGLRAVLLRGIVVRTGPELVVLCDRPVPAGTGAIRAINLPAS